MTEEMRKMFTEIKLYTESSEVQIDGEWGDCRSLEVLQEAGEMPHFYYKICQRLDDEQISTEST